MPYGMRPPDPETVDALLRFDGLAEAERLTGESYKDSEATMALGFGLSLIGNQAKVAALRAAMDTHFSMTWSAYLSVVRALGFAEVYSAPFVGKYGKGREDEFKVFWRNDGLLLKAESFVCGEGEPSCNSAELLFNWRSHDPANAWTRAGIACSGGLAKSDRSVFVGHKDVREGLRHFIASMEGAGSWLTPWIERPWLWLLNYEQPKVDGYDHKAITEAVIATFPADVRAAISPEV